MRSIALIIALSFSLFASLYGQTKYSICELQGSGALSPYDGEMVKTKGIVTADFSGDDQLKGFFIQSECDPTIPGSSGVFVYTGNDPQVLTVGDEVELVAEVKEFFDLTELTNIAEFSVISSGNSVEPTTIRLPLNRRSDLELYEGMLVSFDQELFVTDHFNLGRYGEVRLSADDILRIPTQSIDPNDTDPDGVNFDGASNVQQVLDQEEANRLNYIILDDGSTQQNPSPVPYLDEDDQTLTIGSSIEQLEGVLTYAFGEYRLHPTEQLEFDLESRGDEIVFIGDVPPLIKICAFNVLNYFTTLNVWGASSTAELERQTNKVTNALEVIGADIFGLMEIENNGADAYSALLGELNSRIDLQVYEALDANDPGSFNTKSVIFYNPSVVEPVGSLFTTDPTQFERSSLAQVFKPKGQEGGEFLFVINHLRFKGCDGASGANEDQNDGQACFNQRRKNQVEALVSFIDDVKTQTGVEAVFIMGDMNAYYQEDPIDLFRANGYESYFDDEETSFIFQGESGALDHAMLNEEARSIAYEGQILHINSMEPRFLDYSDDNAAFYQDNEYRSSDHDPVILWINQDKLLSNPEQLVNRDFPSVYPNPSQGELNIDVPQNLNIHSMEVFDLEGNLISKLEKDARQLNLGHWKSGVYIVEIKTGDYSISLPWIKN